ncbi:MAG: alpha-amylase family glycosyl hydrolase [Fusobacteriota bacterium]
MQRKKRVFFKVIIMMISILMFGCFSSNEQDKGVGVSLERSGDQIKIIAANDFDGIDLKVEGTDNNLKEENNFTKIKIDEGRYILAGSQKISAGQTIGTLDNISGIIEVEAIRSDLIEQDGVVQKRVDSSTTNKLLGDFNSDEIVETLDLQMFSDVYGIDSTNVNYDEIYDIYPANLGTGIWADIYSISSPDNEIGLLDFIILARNFNKVKPKEIQEIVIEGPTQVYENESINLSATAIFTDNSQSTDGIQWSSSDETIATVTGGKVDGLSVGNSDITASRDGINSIYSIEVLEQQSQGITIYLESETAPDLYAWSTTEPKVEYLGGWDSPQNTLVNKDGLFYYHTFPEEATEVNYIPFLDDQSDDLLATQDTWVTADGEIYNSYPYGPTPPSVSANPGTTSFSDDSISVTLNYSGDEILEARYTVDGSDPATGILYQDGETITFGETLSYEQSMTLKLYSTNGTEIATDEFVYTKKEKVAPNNNFNNLRIYQVMVSTFQNGDNNIGYGTGYGESHHMGDLVGIKEAIPYMSNLGANAIWMTPIFHTYGDGALDSTGYFTNDYFSVDPNFGTEQDLRDLIAEARKYNMYVILDGVFGHHNGSGEIPASPSGYTVYGSNDPVSYPDSLDFYKEVSTYWIEEYGIDGWRLDQAYQVTSYQGMQDRSYWPEIREAVEQVSQERENQGETWGTLGYMVGEIWKGEQEINDYGYEGYNGEIGLRSNFDFPVRYSLVQTLAQEEWGTNNGKRGLPASNLDAGMDKRDIYPDFAIPNTFLTNHDLIRFGNLVKEAHGYGQENPDYWKRHKAALSFLTMQTGPITLYYGDEIGQMSPGSYAPDDGTPNDRGLYWDHWARDNGKISNFTSQEQDLHDYTKSLMNLRDTYSALWNGDRVNLIGNDEYVYSDLKVDGDQRIVYLVNVSTETRTVSLPASTVGGTTLRNLMGENTISESSGNYSINVPSLSGVFYIVE